MRVLAASLLLLVILLAGRAAGQEATALPPVDLGDARGIAQGTSAEGYPQLGRRDAPVQIVAFCGFDVAACGAFHAEVFPALLPRIAAGDVLYTAVLLSGEGELRNGRAAARAALCAAAQGAFWLYTDALYAMQPEGEDAFALDRLTGALADLGVDPAAWQTCMLGEEPDDVLESGAAALQFQAEYAGALPYVLVNRVPSLPTAASLMAAVDAEIVQATDAAADATEPPPVVTVEPLLGERIEPPLGIALPDGWRRGFDALVLEDVDGVLRPIPVAVYAGPVSGGQGLIVVLWGFPNLSGVNPLLGGTTADLWSDGLRLLRLAVIEQGCNIGTDLRTEYTVGGRPAVGTQFSAVDCPELPDTRGWFAGVQQGGLNFVFYAYTDPIEAMTGARPELQAVLDSVTFHVETGAEATPTPEP